MPAATVRREKSMMLPTGRTTSPSRKSWPPRPDMLSLAQRIGRADTVVLALHRVLLQENAIGTVRNRRAGEDTDGFALAQRPGKGIAGRRNADKFQACARC